MTKFPENNGRTGKPVSLFFHTRRSGMFDVEPYDRLQPQSLAEVRDNIRLKGFLKRAVEKDFAPESLINSIKIGIRR
jgi:hypothetical protein